MILYIYLLPLIVALDPIRLSPSGRVLNKNNPDLPTDVDDDPFTPKIINGIQHTPFGDFELSSVYKKSPAEIVFNIPTKPEWLIKFSHDCVCKPGLCVRVDYHPIVREARLMMKATRAGLATDSLYISPPSWLGSFNGTLPFEYTSTELSTCASFGSTVRYMIFDRPNEKQILRSFTRPVSPDTAVLFGGHLLKAVAKLHEQGIVHGNLGMDNIVLDKDSTGTFRVLLSNFLYGYDESETAYAHYPRPSVPHIDMSSHELGGGWLYNYTRGDDISRVIEIVGRLMNTEEYENIESILLHFGELAQWKRKGNFFGIPLVFDALSGSTLTDPLREKLLSVSSNQDSPRNFEICIQAFTKLPRVYAGAEHFKHLMHCFVWMHRELTTVPNSTRVSLKRPRDETGA